MLLLKGRGSSQESLLGIDKPVGVAGYDLIRDTPERLKDSLPAPDELEEKNSI